MLAEVTGGESRAQILDLLGERDLDALRERANRIWNANYRSGDGGRCVPGSSIWLNENIPLNAETLKTLAADFYSSSFQGDMGSGDYLKCMQRWLNEATGGLLEQQAGDLSMDPNDVLILLVTLWYEAGWTEEFYEVPSPVEASCGTIRGPGWNMPAAGGRTKGAGKAPCGRRGGASRRRTLCG